MKVRKISAILVAVMILSLAAGCGKKSTEENASDLREKYSKYVELGKYKGVEYTPQHTVVTEDDVKNRADQLIQQYTTTETATEGIATMGDTVNIDFVGKVDGEEFEGGSSNGAGYDLTLGTNTFIDDFEEQIAGHSPGDAFDVKVKFPNDYGNKDLAGKNAVFETTLNYISISHAPEYDDALIATATDYKTVKEYEEATKKELEESASENDANANKNTIFGIVTEDCNVTEYPEKEVEDRVQSIMDNVEKEAESNGTDLNTYLSNYGYTVDQFKDTVKESAQNYIREKMIISAISLKENIDVSDEEVAAKESELLEQSGMTDKKAFCDAYGFVEEDFYFTVLEEKVVEFIYENAVEVEATETDAEETTEEVEMVDDYGTTEEKKEEE